MPAATHRDVDLARQVVDLREEKRAVSVRSDRSITKARPSIVPA